VSRPDTRPVRKKLGRPPVAAELKRRNRVVTLVTDRELEILEHVASERESTLSTVVHQILGRSLRSLRRRRQEKHR